MEGPLKMATVLIQQMVEAEGGADLLMGGQERYRKYLGRGNYFHNHHKHSSFCIVPI